MKKNILAAILFCTFATFFSCQKEQSASLNPNIVSQGIVKPESPVSSTQAAIPDPNNSDCFWTLKIEAFGYSDINFGALEGWTLIPLTATLSGVTDDGGVIPFGPPFVTGQPVTTPPIFAEARGGTLTYTGKATLKIIVINAQTNRQIGSYTFLGKTNPFPDYDNYFPIYRQIVSTQTVNFTRTPNCGVRFRN